jgi:hypothetical protein
MIRRNIKRKEILLNENDVERQARQDRENAAAKRRVPGKKGPAVFIWEKENGVRTRTLLTRGQVEGFWGRYGSSQRIYDSIDNCWDLCSEFDEGTAGQMDEYDSNDSEYDTYRPKPSQRASPPISDCPPMVVDSISPLISSDPPSMLVDPTPAQASPDPPPMLDDLTTARTPLDTSMLDGRDPSDLVSQSEGDFISSDEDDEDPYDASRKDVLNAYSFVALDLEQMPVTKLEDLLYYRYGFSLNELPYTGIPPSTPTAILRSWTEVCRAVGGQHLQPSVVPEDRNAIRDFLSILAESPDPFKDIPAKYWDLTQSGQNPLAIVDLDKVYISIEERHFTDGKHYIIRPRLLHPSRDMPWLLSVDSMTALECIRRRLGPHTIDIANFLISHGVHFHTLQCIPNSVNSENPPERPRCRYLGYRAADYSFDLADYAGYEALRDSFLRSQSHGPLALRQGGIIARLAREVLPNSNALSGPSSEALSGHRARFIYGDEIYVDDSFSEEELGLICGTYVLGNSNRRGGNKKNLFKLLLV